MKKKLLGIMISMLLAAVSASAAEIADLDASFNTDTNKITVSGVYSEADKKITVMLTALDGESSILPENISVAGIADEILYLGEITTDSEGSFKYEFKLDDSKAKSGTYTVYFSQNSMAEARSITVDYLSLFDRTNALGKINEAHDEEIINAVIEYGGLIGVDTSGILDNELIAGGILLRKPQDGFSSAAELQAAIDKSVAMYNISLAEDADGLIAALNEYAEVAGVDIAIFNSIGTESYNEEETAGQKAYRLKTDVAELIMDQLPQISEKVLTEKINEACMSVEFSNAEFWSELQEFVTKKYRDILGVSSSVTKKLDEINDQAAVFKKMIKCELDSINKVIKAFEKSVNEVYEQESKSKKESSTSKVTSGGTSGGSPAIAAPISVPNRTEPVTAELVKAEEFTDLEESRWAKEAIEQLYAKKIISGYGDGSFKPNNSITREEFVKIICDAFSLDMGENFQGFNDADENAWYYSYLRRASGLVAGMGDGSFGVGRNITREDMAVILYRVAVDKQLIEAADTSDFDDINDFADYSREAVMALKACGVVSGKDGNSFLPRHTATRAETAVIVYRLMKAGGLS